MPILLLGKLLFFTTHSMSVIALPLRDRLAAKVEGAWKAVSSLSFVAGAPPVKTNGAIVVLLGLAAYTLFALWLHAGWFGADPLIGL